MNHARPSSLRWLTPGLLLWLVLVGGGWLASDSPARPPAQDQKEEKEDPKKPARKPPKLEDEPGEAKPAAGKADGKLAAAVAKTDDPAARELFRTLMVPFDRLKFAGSGDTVRVE